MTQNPKFEMIVAPDAPLADFVAGDYAVILFARQRQKSRRSHRSKRRGEVVAKLAKLFGI